MAKRRDGWTDGEIATILRNPGMTAKQLAALLPGRSVQAVKRKRSRIGRFPGDGGAGLCVRCDERPVWSESAHGRAWRMCKGCTLAEEQQRIDEEAAAALVRQHRKRRRGGWSAKSAPQKGQAE